MRITTGALDERECIQIGNLASGSMELQLRSLFLAYGPVISYARPVDPETGRPGPLAYIEMAPEQALAAIAGLDGRVVGGLPIAVTPVATLTAETLTRATPAAVAEPGRPARRSVAHVRRELDPISEPCL